MTVTPNHVPCRHCGIPISWDEYCWTHDDTGFADCGLVITGGRKIEGVGVVDPVVIVPSEEYAGKTALPVGEWS